MNQQSCNIKSDGTSQGSGVCTNVAYGHGIQDVAM